MKTRSVAALNLQPRVRVRVGNEIALGPGKVELLEFVQQTGSITEAAKRMGMSYMRAWKLIRTMNGCFKQPLVLAVRGGRKGGGGAAMTETGRAALTLYQQMEANSLEAMRPGWDELQRLLRR